MSLSSLLAVGRAASSLFKGSSPSPGDQALSLAKGAMSAQQRLGINALELIRGGAGAGNWQSGPRVGSSATFADSYDQLSDILTGRQAKKDAREEVEDELRRIQLDQAKGALSARGPRVGSGSISGDRGNVGPEGQTATVTDISAAPLDDDDRQMSDPNRLDFGNLTERHGESELIEALAFPLNWAFDRAYNMRLSDISRVTGQSRAEIHRQIAEGGPEVARSLYAQVINEKKPGTGRSPSDPAFWGLPESAPQPPRLPSSSIRW